MIDEATPAPQLPRRYSSGTLVAVFFVALLLGALLRSGFTDRTGFSAGSMLNAAELPPQLAQSLPHAPKARITQTLILQCAPHGGLYNNANYMFRSLPNVTHCSIANETTSACPIDRARPPPRSSAAHPTAS